jgi:hypothetical protein
MFVLDGGGACWSSLCAASATVEDAYAPAGIAAGSADNYFGDWNVVFVPYCDGSVFSGDNDFTLPDGTVRYHRGRRNLTAAFDVALEQFGASERVMVAGFSAGGYGTISGMIAARLMYPQADLFIVNDSGPGVQNPEQAASTEERIAEWQFNKAIPMSCTECGDGRGQLTQLYAWMMERDANVKVSVLSYFGDAVIGTAFNALSAADYETLLRTETGKVQEAYPERFKRFMLPGTAHVVSAGWGSVTADGVLVDDWVSAMVTEDDSVWVDILASGS